MGVRRLEPQFAIEFMHTRRKALETETHASSTILILNYHTRHLFDVELMPIKSETAFYVKSTRMPEMITPKLWLPFSALMRSVCAS